MRIAFVGKGGSGKTTLAALFARSLALRGRRVLAIDADVNQQLAATLDPALSGAALPELGNGIAELKEYLRGENPRITSASEMIKTTPPGRGSRLLRLGEANPIFDRYVREILGVRVLSVGGFQPEDLGTKCYHAKTSAVELMLNHLLDDAGEYVVADMTAGTDAFASGLFAAFDLTAVVVQPTLKSVGVWRQYEGYARPFGVRLAVVANHIRQPEEEAFLRTHLGGPLTVSVPFSEAVRRRERGEDVRLEPALDMAMARLKVALDGCVRDWRRSLEFMHAIHRKNAIAWGNAATGQRLEEQIDPEFVLAP